ncbi:MAG: GNAT family N-acetyltransferase [Leptolyngbyaceae cyanobacterium bins.302]|nr:GNAT family N-acetyltransferase [Leptolyngbyaceae cyanobacterium bins.302]
MTVSFSLPPGCTIRRACPTDRASLHHLLIQFRQEVLPPTSQTEWTLRIIAGGLLGGMGIHVALWLGWQRFINLLLGPGAIVGVGVLAAAWITWNEDWKNFWVIEHQHQLVACAKLRCHPNYSLLHDVYVVPEWRSQGLGSHMVSYLGTQATKPLYLTCMPNLRQFYLRLGFMPVSSKTLSPLIQYDLGIPGRIQVIPLVLK